MKIELYDYDIYPKVFLTGRKQTVTVHPLGCHAAFRADTEYTVAVKESRVSERFPGSGGAVTVSLRAETNGDLKIPATFPREGMYQIQISNPEKRIVELRVYALEQDMAGKYPFRGDLHLHSCRSDGREDPAVVVANYRGHGYDFTVLSDHRRYYPSLEMRQTLRIGKDDQSDLTDFLIVPGEEVHLPLNDVHFVNFGGKFSINALVTPNKNQEKAGDDPAWRSFDGTCPDPMTQEEYEAMIRERAKDVPLSLESERLSYAAAQWIYEKEKESGGLGIFPHPYWLTTTMQLSEDYLTFFYEHPPFDAFEVLGGESYYQHNGFQTAFYYAEKVKGFDPPVVGSTDSHGSTEHNRNALVCSTILFAPENTTQELIDAVKRKDSVAVDTVSAEYRLVGDMRWVKYGAFLMDEWYPLHDRICAAEGNYLKQFVTGDENAEKVLLSMKGQIPRMLRKYFAVEE